MSAIGAAGLQLYNFGQTVSMVFFTDNWKPASFHDRIRENRSIGLHTLVLLDIKVKEQTPENMMRGRKIFEPPRYMTVGQCARQMLEIEEIKKAEGEGKDGVYTEESLAVGAARVGGKTEKFVSGTLKELCDADEVLGAPLPRLGITRRTSFFKPESAASRSASAWRSAFSQAGAKPGACSRIRRTAASWICRRRCSARPGFCWSAAVLTRRISFC